MPKYQQNFKKIVWGYMEVEADSIEEAERKFEDSEYDEFDNKSDYELEEWKKVATICPKCKEEIDDDESAMKEHNELMHPTKLVTCEEMDEGNTQEDVDLKFNQ